MRLLYRFPGHSNEWHIPTLGLPFAVPTAWSYPSSQIHMLPSYPMVPSIAFSQTRGSLQATLPRPVSSGGGGAGAGSA